MAPSGNYGNWAEDLARYCCNKKLKLDEQPKKHIDLFYIRLSDTIYNKQLKPKFNLKNGVVIRYFEDQYISLNLFNKMK